MEPNKRGGYNVCARAHIETKLRPVEEQVGKKWDTRPRRFPRVLKPDRGAGV